MTRSKQGFDFIVAGGGITAAVVASLLVERKLAAPGRVAMVAEPMAMPDASPNISDWDVRVFALSRASQRVLGLCGIWSRLPPDKSFAYERMCVWDARGEPYGAGSLAFDCAELGEPNLGFIVEASALQSACSRAAGAAGVVLTESSAAGIDTEADRITVRLRDGRDIGGALLIVADGAQSPTRRLLGIDTGGHAYHQDALVVHVRTEKSHRNTAWQRFLPTGPLAFLPMPDGRSSIVWSTQRAEAARLRGLDRGSLGAALEAASGGFFGSCEIVSQVASFPLELKYASDYVRPRAVLVGDAAHVVHPLAGQGLNLGLMDCAALVDVLSRAGAIGDRRALREYERWRRSENLLAATALDAMERLFSSPDRAVSSLRRAGLAAVSRMPFVKRQLAARALGLRGDIPKFLL